uniref:Uncharacterized protein n=1 Tax=Rangifer tarandus platyrhynchus TaxID=3082113 RepID=A0ACB0DZJ5_RANTA|nr:unnamed protein product [Rangifer tarandus platyrhynchus]
MPKRPVLAFAPSLRCCSPADGLAPPVFTPVCPAIQPQLPLLLQENLPDLGVFTSLGSSYSHLCSIGRPTRGTGPPPRLGSGSRDTAGQGHFPAAGGESRIRPEGRPPPARLFLACPLASGTGLTSPRCPDGMVPAALSCPGRVLSQLAGTTAGGGDAHGSKCRCQAARS